MGFKRQTGTTLIKDCLDYLNNVKGIFAFRVNTTGVWDNQRKVFRTFQGLKGVSDILGVLEGGTMLAVEVKVGKDRLTADQAYFLDTVNRKGGVGFVVKSLDDLIAALTQLDA